MKINKPGLILRNKSFIHTSIIDGKTGRRKRDKAEIISNKDLLKQEKNFWGLDGEVVRDHQKESILLDVEHLKTLNHPVNILILGPGQGAEAIFLKKQLEKTENHIDTFGITNMLTKDAKAVVRKDYSPESRKQLNKKLFEHFNHLDLVGKYDYIYSAYGPMQHTKHSGIVLIKIISLLRPGGFARIYPRKQLDHYLDYFDSTNNRDNVKLETQGNNLIIRRLK